MQSPSRTCRLCDQPAVSVGSVDFNKSGADVFAGSRQFPESGVQVEYLRCQSCGYMFTPHFDGWTDGDFREQVYNAGYLKADPPFTEERPGRLAGYLAEVLGERLSRVSLVDFGSGTGRMVELLRSAGLGRGVAYDRYHGDGRLPSERFDIVTAFEVVEHVVDQQALFQELCSLVAEEGVLVLSTLLQPADIGTLGASWWYACPRNGHLGFHTAQTLEGVLRAHGFKLWSLSPEVHVAARGAGDLAVRFIESGEPSQVSGVTPEA